MHCRAEARLIEPWNIWSVIYFVWSGLKVGAIDFKADALKTLSVERPQQRAGAIGRKAANTRFKGILWIDEVLGRSRHQESAITHSNGFHEMPSNGSFSWS
jgi:hypothetical protein